VKNTRKNYRKPWPLLVFVVRLLSLLLSKLVWRIEFQNTENIPAERDGRGLLITPNHQTYLDPFWVSLPVKRDLRFMAWDEAFGWFLIGRLIARLGAFPVSLRRGGTVTALKESLKFLTEGKTLIVFPEGEREFPDGRLLPFKTGAVRLAMEAGVPILPVTVIGGNRVWPRGQKFPRFGKIRIVYHPPVEFTKPADPTEMADRCGEISERLREIISPQD
jgi:1-acyl-sn-glycerol-3-phosphate acyltransferase